MKKITALIVLIMASQISAQVSAELDYATFKYNDEETLTEIYYAIPTAGLKFVEIPSGKIQAQIMVRVSVAVEGNIRNDETWKMEKTLKDTSEINFADRMMDVLRYLMKPGDYVLSFYVQDLNDKQNNCSLKQLMKIPGYSDKSNYLSDIQLASSMRKAELDTTNVFWKNGLEVTPNPASLYSTNSPMLFYYLESYHLNQTITGEYYKNRVQVTTTEGHSIESVTPKTQQKKILPASLEIGTLNVSSLPSGTYHLKFDILDTNDNVLCAQEKTFYFYNPDQIENNNIYVKELEASFLQSDFAEMNLKELETDFRLTQYFSMPEEMDFYEKLDDVQAKRRFLYKLWKIRDPNPETDINEYRIEYLRRVEQANNRYRSYFQKGWRTDRGRVYLLYGEPSDVERYPNNPTSFAHEIWHYEHIEGGVKFVFVDLQEFGEYRQIHSTKRGETTHQDWERIIEK